MKRFITWLAAVALTAGMVVDMYTHFVGQFILHDQTKSLAYTLMILLSGGAFCYMTVHLASVTVSGGRAYPSFLSLYRGQVIRLIAVETQGKSSWCGILAEIKSGHVRYLYIRLRMLQEAGEKEALIPGHYYCYVKKGMIVPAPFGKL